MLPINSRTGEFSDSANSYLLSAISIPDCPRYSDTESSLSNLLLNWKNKYPHAEVVGHNYFESTKKTCPNFDVKKWLKKESVI